MTDITEQQENMSRVSDAITPLVMEFWNTTNETGDAWHMEELTNFVSQRTTVAPDSAGRILRSLRQQGKLNYRCIERHKSLYESLPLKHKPSSVRSVPRKKEIAGS
jgi:hypothetical protein